MSMLHADAGGYFDQRMASMTRRMENAFLPGKKIFPEGLAA
jgi:hypothetical protein